MSFALTTEQFKNRTKTVTRRKGRKFLKPGDVVMGCKKCMGLKPGEKLERLGRIRIIDTKREYLSDMTFDLEYGQIEAVREGFPEMTPDEFVSMFVDHMGGDVNQEVTRIEFEYL
ncbi:MAG: ASCH domain-containing protein [Candidatus Thiodiazotropha sp. (ex Codakia orbicularis)]|nr:ASCH domain-containing protein [Candidatus Thiodiazotropha sp. (ex Codakia orbicularis)]